MDYYGLLFLYYLKGLSGKSVLKLFFNIETGGTEQLLPENTSTPTTSPLLADIQYPDGLRTDQYFTYRETPTTVSNKARIKTIKGNTIVWNQLQLIPTNSSTTSNGITFTNNNDGSVTANGTATGTAIFYCNSFSLTSGHKYLFKGCPSGGTNNTYMQSIRVNSASTIIGTDVGNGDVYTANTNYTDGTILLRILSGVTLNNAKFYPQAFDLTLMGLDSITSVDEFTSLFHLSYYGYNAGTLLSFNGTGLKAVGFNLWDGNSENGKWINDYSTGEVSTAGSTYNVTDFIPVFPDTTYYHTTSGSRRIMFYDGNKNPIPMTSWQYPDVAETIVSPPNAHYIRFTIANDYLNNFCFNISDQSKDGTYEPYTTSTTNLPVSTYFPTGMKSAKTIHDELTPLKAITRIGTCSISDFGNTDPGLSGGGLHWADFAPSLTVAQSLNILTNYGLPTIAGNDAWQFTEPCITANGVRLRIYCRTTDVKTEFSGMQINYELKTPIETPITTEDANEALSLLMGKSVSSNNAKQMIDIITKGE